MESSGCDEIPIAELLKYAPEIVFEHMIANIFNRLASNNECPKDQPWHPNPAAETRKSSRSNI